MNTDNNKRNRPGKLQDYLDYIKEQQDQQYLRFRRLRHDYRDFYQRPDRKGSKLLMIIGIFFLGILIAGFIESLVFYQVNPLTEHGFSFAILAVVAIMMIMFGRGKRK